MSSEAKSVIASKFRGGPPLVSLVIPAYNGRALIGRTIESILAQTWPAVEIIVVDDGSTDGTADVVARFGDRVRFLRQKNSGTAAARNLGLQQAKGEFFAVLDQDDLWMPHKLERQMPRFLEDPKIGVVYAGIEFFHIHSGEVTATYYPSDEPDVHDVLGHMTLAMQTMVFRRSALDRIGLFDASLAGTDDWDISIRMAAEFRIVGINEILGRVGLHQNQQGRNAPQMFTNAMRVLDKHTGLHPGCARCRKAIRQSRAILREHYYGHFKGRAFAAWRAGRHAAAAIEAVRGFWQYPPAIRRVLARTLFGIETQERA